jgi:Putative Flp pilus-assembly TadE/G-like
MAWSAVTGCRGSTPSRTLGSGAEAALVPGSCARSRSMGSCHVSRSRGQAVPLFALFAPTVPAFMGRGIDVAQSLVERRDAQGAADLASLAGARHLDGDVSSADQAAARAAAVAVAVANGYSASHVVATTPYDGDDDKTRVTIDSSVDMYFLRSVRPSPAQRNGRGLGRQQPHARGRDHREAREAERQQHEHHRLRHRGRPRRPDDRPGRVAPARSPRARPPARGDPGARRSRTRPP